MSSQLALLTSRVEIAAPAALALWLLGALAAGLSGVFYRAPATVVGATIWSLTVVVLLAVWLIRPLRAMTMELPLETLVVFHVVRFVGFAFLILHAWGELPFDFATRAGWTNIGIATLALLIAALGSPIGSHAHWWSVLAWNVVGLYDILMVLRTGMRLALADLESMAALTAFPLNLLPIFIVPLIIVTHVIIFGRLWHDRRALRAG